MENPIAFCLKRFGQANSDVGAQIKDNIAVLFK